MIRRPKTYGEEAVLEKRLAAGDPTVKRIQCPDCGGHGSLLFPENGNPPRVPSMHDYDDYVTRRLIGSCGCDDDLGMVIVEIVPDG